MAKAHAAVDSPVLMLTASDGSHATRSGYAMLADYMAGAECLHARRAEPKGLLPRVLVKLLSRTTFTRWYRLGSASLEWRAWRRFRDFEGVVHVMWADRDLGFLDLVRNRRRHRLCGTFHSCPDTFPDNLQFPRRLRTLDAIILMSSVQRGYFEAHGVPAEKIHVVLHGVDTKFFSPAPVPKVGDGTFEVLSVGNYRRNFLLLKKVCERMEGRRSVRFKIVAPRRWHETFAGLNNVQTMSDLSDEQLLGSYREADCFLLTVDASTANNALLEALACGLPVVAEAVDGIPEYVSPECAKLVARGSDSDLVQALLSLMSDAGERQRMAAAARQRAEQLDWANVAERTREVYRRIV